MVIVARSVSNVVYVLGSNFGLPRALSRPAVEARFSYLSSQETPNPLSRPRAPTPSMYFSGHQVPDFTSNAKRLMDKYSISTEAMVEETKENFVDPETAKVGHTKRPMILTHSVMV